MEPGKLDFFGTGKSWLNYRNPGIQISLITGWGDDSTMPPFDRKENRQKNKTQTGLETRKSPRKKEMKYRSLQSNFTIKLNIYIFNEITVCG